MATLGSPEWVAAALEAAQRADLGGGPSMTVRFEIADTPDGKARWWITLRDGEAIAADTGKPDDCDVTVEAKWKDFVRVLDGEVAADLAFMQGRLKVDGAYPELLFERRKWLASPAVRAVVSEVAALDC